MSREGVRDRSKGQRCRIKRMSEEYIKRERKANGFIFCLVKSSEFRSTIIQ